MLDKAIAGQVLQLRELIKLETVIVVGNGMVGFKYLEKLTSASANYRVITFAEEPRPAYDRVHLSEYFSGKSASELSLAPLAWYEQRGIDLRLGDAICSINKDAKTVLTHSGDSLHYDKLILATGSYPFVPPVKGINKTGVLVYRTIEDLDNIIAYSKSCKKAAVIGGGLLGLEAANALLNLGLETHVIEFAPRLMPRQIDQIGSDVLRKHIKALGVSVHTSMNTQEILGNDKVEAMVFADGQNLEVDMIVVSAGIRPRDELAKEAGLRVGERGGVVVNEQLLSSDPNIYAVGECALYDNMIYGLVAPGYRMAETAVNHLLGQEADFTGSDMSTKLKLMGIDVASIGHSTLESDDVDTTLVMNTQSGIYKKLITSQNDKTLLGAVLVGDASDYGTLLQLYLNKMSLPETPESLLVANADTSASMGVEALPNEAMICSCENISKGSICAAISEGCHSVSDLKSSCKAGTGCGSCVPLLTDLINHELEQSGIVVDKSLCEHFPYTRQELLEIVKVAHIKTFDELLGRYGKGSGCETCKPAIASILASTWNEHVMAHQMIQDTNDRFMANMQKNGTYSVVPRVPGGEITADQLIRLGEVAKSFNLYSKITGGQRVDLFGARLEDLPLIWRQLLEVGFETGHAYAKSLRTVKSCVGESWCRFGVQDSTTLAIDLENRYKGLRTPHKVKMAVSGCARECAEAQSKDVGVIATEKGWNLYVCGNGGMKPQHAVLLASDLSTEEIFKYTDRFLMYYVRTAEKLQRTATWLNKLEGGIEHLKDVVINDNLAIGADLEKDMQYVVDTYQCEWKTTLEDTNLLERFRPFVNTKEADPSIAFTKQRGQPLPVVTTNAATPKSVAGD